MGEEGKERKGRGRMNDQETERGREPGRKDWESVLV